MTIKRIILTSKRRIESLIHPQPRPWPRRFLFFFLRNVILLSLLYGFVLFLFFPPDSAILVWASGWIYHYPLLLYSLALDFVVRGSVFLIRAVLNLRNVQARIQAVQTRPEKVLVGLQSGWRMLFLMGMGLIIFALALAGGFFPGSGQSDKDYYIPLTFLPMSPLFPVTFGQLLGFVCGVALMFAPAAISLFARYTLRRANGAVDLTERLSAGYIGKFLLFYSFGLFGVFYVLGTVQSIESELQRPVLWFSAVCVGLGFMNLIFHRMENFDPYGQPPAR